MNKALEINLAGRLLLLMHRKGITTPRARGIYQAALSAAVQRVLDEFDGDNPGVCERVLEEQIAMLEEALRARGRSSLDTLQPAEHPMGDAGAVIAQCPSQPWSDPLTPEPAGADAAAESAQPARQARAPSGYVPPVRSMEEKLHDQREPIQVLLVEDCVRVGLVDAQTAAKLVAGMSGKTTQQAEQDIVEQLRQVLQDQVKSFIRKAKGGPWADPRTQEDLRQDIHAARSVRSILLLARQVLKEYQTWQAENGRGGILGLFSPRHRIARQ